MCGPLTSEVWGLRDPFKESTKAEIISKIIPTHHLPTSCPFSLAYTGEFFRSHMPFDGIIDLTSEMHACVYLNFLEPSKIIFPSW